MALPDKTIDPRLIESAKIEFMEKGYDKTSINYFIKEDVFVLCYKHHIAFEQF